MASYAVYKARAGNQPLKTSILLAVLATVSLESLHAVEWTPVGFVKEIAGRVFVCTGEVCDAAHAVALDPKKDIGRILFENQSLQCEGDQSRALIHTSVPLPGNSPNDFAPDLCKRGKAWVHMPAPREAERIEGQTPENFVAALRSYGRRAGREKASESPIYSPPEKGSVIASNFVLRWRTRPPLGKFSILLLDAKGAEIASLNDVDGGSGVLESDALQKALSDYRDAAQSNRDARVVLKTETGTETEISFSILSQTQERALQKALEQVDSSHGLFQHVERAAIFERAQMFDMVAAEYDAALNEAPSSRDMMQAAFNANARIGNLRRARELRDKLREMDAQAAK